MLTLRGNQSTSRAINRLLVLNHLRRFGPASRSELALATGLSNAAVTFVTTELIDQHLIVEGAGGVGRAPLATGRRPVPLDLNYGGHFAIGFKLMEHRLHGVLTDFGIRGLDGVVAEVDGRDPDESARVMADTVAGLFARNPGVRERLVGIGLAMSGQIDADHGVCLRSNRLGWTNVPIARMIAERTGFPVWADNDLNSFAVAEHLFGKARNASSLAVATFGRGVGAALIVRGALHRGRTGAAAELGHVKLFDEGDEMNAPECECGKRGCLEAYTGEPALLGQYAVATGTRLETIGALGERGAAGDGAALAILDRAGRRLGAGIATLASLFDPDALVIGGEGVRLGRPLLDPLLEVMRQRMFQQAIDVRVEDWGDDAWARGAAALAIDSFFNLAGAGAMAPVGQVA